MAHAMHGPSVTDTSYTCIREYVAGAFEDVVRILRSNRARLGIESRLDEDQGRADFVHHGMADVAVRVGGVDASLRVFRIVGGTLEPVAELVLVARSTRGSQFPTSATEFVQELVAALEQELCAA